jgi:hypothetical protein
MFNYPIGTVVMYNVPGDGLFKNKRGPVYGHVMGFGRVEWETSFETVLLVRWDSGEEFLIHPNNVLTS